MYRGFNVDIDINAFRDYQVIEIVNEQKELIRKKISDYLSPTGSLDGSQIEADWFPQINADIFISHSHADENIAKALAGWLYVNLGLTAFVDSTIWGYSNELLKGIDYKYCKIGEGPTLDYSKVKRSTAHIHLMLAAALSKMMDSTECIFFLNTPNSISTRDVVDKHQTNSPWIYFETSISGMIRKPLNKHSNRIRKTKTFAVTERLFESHGLDINYNLSLDHLTNITQYDLKLWEEKHSKLPREMDFPLDMLYELFK